MGSIRIRALTKAFPWRGGRLLPVLDNVTIDAEDHQFVCLLGPSGSGKSTTLNILAGLIDPDSGLITVDGASDYRHVRYGYVFQRPRLLNWKTVRGNLSFVLSASRVPRREWDDRVRRYVRLVGLDQFADEYPMRLSGGMQQRVAIARALVIDPAVLLMDEPFSHLDELTARRMRVELLKIWHQDRRTILFVTHNPLEAAYLADKIYVFSRRPATVVSEVAVDIPRPRDIDDPALVPIRKRILQRLLEVGDGAEV
jgi:ABC-type nitrate/sulfonate/bicarbonate transport system ATPase subunit